MPPTDGLSQRHFLTFAHEVYGYQKTLVWLVSGSFVISGVASFANVSTHSTSYSAMATLVGTVAGCSAVTGTYLKSARQPDKEDYTLLCSIRRGLLAASGSNFS